jgi:hypothetical protein
VFSTLFITTAAPPAVAETATAIEILGCLECWMFHFTQPLSMSEIWGFKIWKDCASNPSNKGIDVL